MSGVARMASGIDVNPNGRHWSLLSFRFPQCVSLRSGLNVRSTFRFNALNANAGHHGGPAKLDDQEQGFYRGLPLLEILLGLRQACDVVASIAQSRELAPTRQRDRIIDKDGPRRQRA
jgi:hypothetical protein